MDKCNGEEQESNGLSLNDEEDLLISKKDK
jgi:hypothetical protein